MDMCTHYVNSIFQTILLTKNFVWTTGKKRLRTDGWNMLSPSVQPSVLPTDQKNKNK